GKERPCYLLTKKGCDMVANKMTGEKGVLFTAKYVTKFEEMEKQLKNQVVTSELSPQLQLLINMELEQKKMKMELQETKKEVQAIKDIIVINPRAKWRKQTNNILNSIGYKTKEYQKVKEEAYKALEERGKCNLKIRLENLQGRALREGMTPSQAKNLNYLDVIENDVRLKEIYIGIVKELAIKNGITVKEEDKACGQ
ncbi:MAG: Rha family transcriptional regulator, partial [Candidatus Micrarchaeota archaeon]|nr:Rha family transcriptional regulator [Candidatus Micrarchaeota archaeon]